MMKEWKVNLIALFVGLSAMAGAFYLIFLTADALEPVWKYEIEQLREQLRQQTDWLDGRTAQLDNRDIQFDERLVLLEISFKPDDIMQSVVHIEADAGWQGSGAYVGNGLILTAGHVVDEGWSFTVTFEDGTEYISTEFYLEEITDVGFIFIGDCNNPALFFDYDGYSRGDSVFVFGNPFGWSYNFSVTKGILSSIDRDCEGFFGEKIMLQVDAAAYPGNSGGPVTDDEGEIIGILVGGPAYGADNIGLCIPSDICEQAMKTYLSILAMAELE